MNPAPTAREHADFRLLAQLARQRGWLRPAGRRDDEHGPRAWLQHWRALEFIEKATASDGPPPRPVPPHIPGPVGPEDLVDQARRELRNLERWEGWPDV